MVRGVDLGGGVYWVVIHPSFCRSKIYIYINLNIMEEIKTKSLDRYRIMLTALIAKQVFLLKWCSTGFKFSKYCNILGKCPID